MKYQIVLACSLLAHSCIALGDVRTANNLYNQGQVNEARTQYETILADVATPAKDRAVAARALAKIDWLINGNASAAAAHFQQALALRSDACVTRAQFARLLRESGDAAAAVEMSRDSSACADQSARDDLITEHAHAYLVLGNAIDAERSLKTTSTLGMLAPSASALNLEAALLRKRPRESLAAWKRYFWLNAVDAPPAFQHEPVRTIFLSGTGPNAKIGSQCRLLDLLTRAGFDEAAGSFWKSRNLKSRGAKDAKCAKAAIYRNFRDELTAYLLTLNRRMALMSVSDKPAMQMLADRLGDYLTASVQKASTALRKIEPPQEGEGPVGTVNRLFNFGSSFGFTSGYPSVHLGHVIRDETRDVAQFGQSAQLNFKVLEQMIGNGFQSWLWDGAMQTGGWGSSQSIVQIRTSYALSAIKSTAIATDPPSRQKAERDAIDHSSKDTALLAEAKASGKVVAFLPGLADRLLLQSIDQLLASLNSVPSATLALHFVERQDELTTRHSIWIHEGRHALDGKFLNDRNFSQADLEYRAKLAEILLADYPRMAFAGINNSLVNSDSSHGIANTRILIAYEKWITNHSDEIAGYDAALPALIQLDKLTDKQLREVAGELADFDDA